MIISTFILFTNDTASEDSFDNNIYPNITMCGKTYFESDRSPLNPVLDCPITFEEVWYKVKNLHAGKAPGPGRLLNEHLIYGGKSFCWLYLQNFNMILQSEW